MEKPNIYTLAFAFAILMGVLVLWKLAYPYTCFAWSIPLITLCFMLLGTFHNIQQMDYAKAKVLFKKDSVFYKLFTQSPINFIKAVFFSLACIIPAFTFTMSAGLVEFIFIMFTSLLTFIFYQKSLNFSQKHLNTHAMATGHKKLVYVLTSLTITAVYIFTLYYFVPVPHFIDPISLENTITTASQDVGSLCGISNFLVKFTQETTATAWFFMVSSSQSSQINLGVWWFLFLFFQSVSFFGLSRIQVEILHAIQILQQQRNKK